MSRIEQAWNRQRSGEERRASPGTAPPPILDQLENERVPPGGEPTAKSPASRRRAGPSANQTRETVEPLEPQGTNSDDLFDVRQLISAAAFAGRAIKRRKLLAIGSFILVLGATAAVVQMWPRTYHVQAKVLAQRNGMMPAISNPARAIPPDADSPTRSAAEVILRHDNLLAMIEKTDLIRRWELTRAPILVLKDRVYAILRDKPTAEERLDAFVGLLEQRLVVSVFPEETISIDIDWPDPQLAYELVRAAVDNFLEERRTGETSAIAESVSILEHSADVLQQDVTAKFAALQLAQTRRSQTARGPASNPSQAPPASPSAPAASPTDAPTVFTRLIGDPETARLKLALESKQQDLAELEDGRRQQLSELQAQLAKDLTIYTENHPAIVNLRQTIASISRGSSQMTALRQETIALEAQYAAALANERAAPPTGEPMIHAADVPVGADGRDAREPVDVRDPLDDDANPEVMRLKGELGELADIRARLESARIELATSRAAFKYRYTVVRPAQVPRRPSKPNVPAVLIAGVLGAFLLALAAPIGAELLGRELGEPGRMPREIGTVPLASGVSHH
jgi:uncharacterized protein involved in exopolysaccharide biosynthesis